MSKIKATQNKRLPTWVGLWADGLDIDYRVFKHQDILYAIENAWVDQVFKLGLEYSKKYNCKNGEEAFANSMEKLMLIGVITDYYSQKPSRAHRKFGESDYDQVNDYDPKSVFGSDPDDFINGENNA